MARNKFRAQIEIEQQKTLHNINKGKNCLRYGCEISQYGTSNSRTQEKDYYDYCVEHNKS